MDLARTTDVVRQHGSEPKDVSKTRLDQVYRRLCQDVITGVHEPGAKLQIERLREQYGVSAGTIREALTRLISDSLVIAIEQRGFRVAPISEDDLVDITETRALLETEALRQSIAVGDEKWECALVGAFHRLTRAESRLQVNPSGAIEDWEESNSAFHEVLIAACPSVWLKKLIGILYRQAIRYRYISALGKGAPRNVHAEHTAIFDATMLRDADTACAKLAEHIRATAVSVKTRPQTSQGASPPKVPRRRKAAEEKAKRGRRPSA